MALPAVSGIMDHDDKPFTVVAILKPTHTPLDRSLYVTLEGIEAMHIDWKQGAPPLKGQGVPAARIRKEDDQNRAGHRFLSPDEVEDSNSRVAAANKHLH